MKNAPRGFARRGLATLRTFVNPSEPPAPLDVIYCATRPEDLDHCERSVRSLLRHEPVARITVYTLREHLALDWGPEVSFAAVEHPIHGFLDKLIAINQFRGPRCLFLDCDTYVTDRLRDLYSLLDSFELCAVHAPNRWTKRIDGIPDCFPELNTGVLLLRRTRKVRRLLRRWRDAFERSQAAGEAIPSMDQPSFREELFHSTIRFYVIPPECNFRFTMGQSAGSKVKILHGYGHGLDEIEKEVNSNEGGPYNGGFRNRYYRWTEAGSTRIEE